MKAIFITIGLMMMLSLSALDSQYMHLKGKNSHSIEFFVIQKSHQLENSSMIIEEWMTDPNYFHVGKKFNTDDSNSKIEDWMKDIHYFESAVLTESSPVNEVIEPWMADENYFYSAPTVPICSIFHEIDNHMGCAKELLVIN